MPVANSTTFDLDEVLDALWSIKNDLDRTSWFQILLALKGAFGDAARDPFLAWTATWSSEPAVMRKAERAWDTARPTGAVTPAAVFRRAYKAGWRPASMRCAPAHRRSAQ